VLTQRILMTAALLSLSGAALAGGPPGVVPEPETLALFAIGAAAIAVARWLKKK